MQTIANNTKPTLIAGPCVIESMELLDTVAQKLVEINSKLNTNIIFKASFDKANRTSLNSFRGPGLEKGLQMLADIKSKYNLQITTDIHESYQAEAAGEVCDILQIPAFLCRQTDLLVSAAKTGKIVNIKKAQFLSGVDMKYPVEKARESGAKDVWLTERGNCFGYNNLVVDFRNIADMKEIVPTVITHTEHAKLERFIPLCGCRLREEESGLDIFNCKWKHSHNIIIIFACFFKLVIELVTKIELFGIFIIQLFIFVIQIMNFLSYLLDVIHDLFGRDHIQYILKLKVNINQSLCFSGINQCK